MSETTPQPTRRKYVLNHLSKMDYSVVQQCMHCGMCLPVCPTYLETRLERNSPRGRIAMMRSMIDGDLPPSKDFAEEMYYCLGCLACMTACPAGVDYATLIETARAEVESQDLLFTPGRRFWRWLTLRLIFTRPRMLHLMGRMLWLYQASGLSNLVRKLGLTKILPKDLRELEPSTPTVLRHFSDQIIEEVESPKQKKYRVGLLTGCVQDLVFSDVNRDTADVLLENNCEVITPRLQGCCGSLHSHNGDVETATMLAKRILDRFDLDSLDAIITNAAGCGSHLKHFSPLLKDDSVYGERAAQWDAKVRDISEWLVEIGFRQPENHVDTVTRATYHEACHLCHGQKITKQPRDVLSSIPGFEWVELERATHCCGSAGIYNITQPEQAGKLQVEKVGFIRDTGADVVATANPGCMLQIQNGAGKGLAVRHPVTLLAEAYRSEAEQKQEQQKQEA